MIRTQNKVPDYYIEKSRDFQVLCRLLDFTLNSVKYNIDSTSKLTDTELAKNTILPLIGDKFGIYDKDAYSTRPMLDALPCAVKYKGSLHSVMTLVNAFLDSMDIFDYATVYNAKDQKSADEISAILNRKVSQYTLVIVLSSYPNLTKLKILDTYLKMVVPTGMFIDYVFGFNKKILDIYKYKDYVLLYYTKEELITDGDTMTNQRVSVVKNKNDKMTYTSAFDNITDEQMKAWFQEKSEETAQLVNSVNIASVENMLGREPEPLTETAATFDVIDMNMEDSDSE